jgi:hypothetical protein
MYALLHYNFHRYQLIAGSRQYENPAATQPPGSYQAGPLNNFLHAGPKDN